jgi:hypothetical protein
MIGAQYTVSSANTWERKEITFPTESSNGELYNTNGQGLYLEWWFTSGTNQTSGSVPTSWEAYAATDRAAGLNVNMADATGNTLYITGVQMEASDYATDFEVRSYGDELAKCQRYYYKPEYDTDSGPYAFEYHQSYKAAQEYFPVTMRATPTSTVTASSGSFTTWLPSPTHWKGYIAAGGTDIRRIASATFDAEL